MTPDLWLDVVFFCAGYLVGRGAFRSYGWWRGP